MTLVFLSDLAQFDQAHCHLVFDLPGQRAFSLQIEKVHIHTKNSVYHLIIIVQLALVTSFFLFSLLNKDTHQLDAIYQARVMELEGELKEYVGSSVKLKKKYYRFTKFFRKSFSF